METMKKENTIENYVVRSVKINVSAERAFAYVASPFNLPLWTNAFKKADDKTALMVTPNGDLPIGLKTKTNKEAGSIDWYMTMPDNSVGKAYSRIVPSDDTSCVFSFILLAPPMPLEELEGTLSQQSIILAKELQKLSAILEDSK